MATNFLRYITIFLKFFPFQNEKSNKFENKLVFNLGLYMSEYKKYQRILLKEIKKCQF